MADRFGARAREADVRFKRQLAGEGIKELPAFDPAVFRQQLETARGEIAAPSLRALEQRARKGQLAGRFTNPAVQAAMQAQGLEGFGAGRGQILAGAGQAALGRELPIQQLQQQGRDEFLSRLDELRSAREQEMQQSAGSQLQDLQLALLKQRRLEGTMEAARQRAGEFMQRSGQRDIARRAEHRAGTLIGESRAERKTGTVGKLSQTASNIIRAFGPSGGRR